MPSPKQVVRKMLEALDDDVSFEEIQYHVYVCQRIERGRKDVDEGRVLTHEEVLERSTKWTDVASGDRVEPVPGDEIMGNGGTREGEFRAEDQELAAILEAARRANWDAMHGPPHLRTGRFRPRGEPEDDESSEDDSRSC